MDPVTHGLIGACTSASFADEDNIGIAGVIGAAGAMLPDLDVFIDRAADPLLQLEYHRTLTHSLAFIPFGALLVTVILWLFVNKKLTFKETYLYSLLGIATAGLADTCTSYGVQLLWPLANRFSWNLISIFDPLLSLVLVVALGITLYKKIQEPARIGLIWVICYLVFGFFQQQRAEIKARDLAEKRGHDIEKLVVKPAIANVVLWSIRYVNSDSLYADGVWLLPLSEAKIYEGDSVPLSDWQKKYASYRGTTLYEDIRRFDNLSDGVLVGHPDEPKVLGDGRYAMLPTSIKPLWGIKPDTARADEHVTFETYRDAGPEVRSRFLEMILGN